MNIKILTGPKKSWSGSHAAITTIEGADYFNDPEEFLVAVKRYKPDVVFLRATGHNNISPSQIQQCPVPVVGFYHDWVCWGSERLEVVAKQVDWLITEKTAYQYLQNMGIKNCSHFLMMSKMGIERALESKVMAKNDKKYDVCCLGSFMIEGYKNILRYDENNKISVYDNTYWSRLGFRGRSKYLDKIAKYNGNVFIAANTSKNNIKEIFTSKNPSFDIIANSLINIHVDHGRKYAANRCFETMAIGTLLFCEEDNEIFDFVPDGIIESYNLDNLYEKIDYYKKNPKKAEEKAKKAQEFALKNFSNKELTKKLVKLVEDNFEEIKRRSKKRYKNPNELNRSLVHWEGKLTRFHHKYKKSFNKDYKTSVSLNEKSWFYFEHYIKCLNKIKYLIKALFYVNKAIENNPNNIVFYWNKAIILYKLKLRYQAKQTLTRAKYLLENNKNFSYNGSIIEIKINWWMSGHIEYDLAIKKINGNHQALTKKAFLYRIDMMLHMMGYENDYIHWPTLPDEYKKIENLEKVAKIDPFDNISEKIKGKIYDFNKN